MAKRGALVNKSQECIFFTSGEPCLPIQIGAATAKNPANLRPQYRDHRRQLVGPRPSTHPGHAGQRPGLPLELQGGKCGSCSAEINGRPRLMCMTPHEARATSPSRSPSRPIKAFPVMLDLVTDVFMERRVKRRFRLTTQAARTYGTCRMGQEEVERVQEFPQVARVLPLPNSPRSCSTTT